MGKSGRLTRAVQSDKNDMQLNQGWHILSSCMTSQTGKEISTAACKDLKTWHKASVPGTVLSALVNKGVYPDPYFGKNLLAIPREPFTCGWWYRTGFSMPEGAKDHVRLYLDGINYRAEIWLNGQLIAGQKDVFGAFRRFEFDVTDIVSPRGTNVLAIQVFPPKPTDYTIGYVDWSPEPPDRNMGLWRGVGLKITGPVSIDDPAIRTSLNMPSMANADISVVADVANHGKKAIDGMLVAKIEDIIVRQPVKLAAGESKTVSLDAKQFPQLRFKNPRVWWPHTLGKPELYQARLEFIVAGKASDRSDVTFGIREITDYLNDKGLRGLKVNGQPLLIRGAGWCDDMMLADTAEKLEHQVQYACHMRLNCLRFEGFWGSSQLIYDLCDRYGLLCVVGWSCQWEWSSHMRGRIRSDYSHVMPPEGEDLICRSFESQVRQMRNHPSLAAWMIGSDRLWDPQMERRHREIADTLDAGRPVFTHIASKESTISGPSGFKSCGPYQYVPPIFWYSGKAKSCNWEACPGAEPPPLESLRRMMPPEHLWPIDDFWNFHCAMGDKFSNMDIFCTALKQRYWYRENLEDFLRRSQMMNYELMRGMFEGYACNKPIATGIIQWMFNAAWPRVYWQLFDHYLMPNGAFYATRKANEPLHLAYHYLDNAVYVVNEHRREIAGLTAEIRVLNLDLSVRHEAAVPFSAAENASACIHKLPSDPNLSETYFLDLRLRQAGKLVSENFYWLSTKPDVMGATEMVGEVVWQYNKILEYAKFHELHKLPPTTLDIKAGCKCAGDMIEATAVLKNTGDSAAFFVELMLVGNRTGLSFLPVFWDDNYVTLLPGETKTLQARFPASRLEKQKPLLQLSGINVDPTTVISSL